MKRILILGLLAAGAVAGVTGCASTDQGQKPAAEAKDTRPPEQRLSVGMTKDEVRKALGEPGGTSTNSAGEESWSYSDSAKAFIPFYSIAGGKVQHLTVTFDKDGKVKNWNNESRGLY